MKDALREIGFYTLFDSRAATASHNTPLWRCELILTSACNFHCPYCRGFEEHNQRTLSFDEAKDVVGWWIAEGLRNVRFSGGEPTLWPWLSNIVQHCADNNVKRIAISTNGSADETDYRILHKAGVNDFSVSLDACCAGTGAKMAGGEPMWDKVIHNIRVMASLCYTTAGVVLTEENVSEVRDIVLLASSLGVADIRLIGAAQQDAALEPFELPLDVLNKHPILAYRYANIKNGRHVRGLRQGDGRRCLLALDDMAAVNGYHYPCIIYMREWGKPIGRVGPTMRDERREWVWGHDCHADPICNKNCLDVCVDYNNRARDLQEVPACV
jgi:MoaA/NifB/PqqE/SkfB family radical SAM enzyme